MFGFSLTKLLFTGLVIAAIWYGFKIIQTRNKLPKKRDPGQGTPFFKHSAPDEVSEELAQCPKCGTYALPGHRCEKDRCPM